MQLNPRRASRDLEAALDGRYTVERELGGGGCVGDDANAFVWFERAVEAHEMWLTSLALDPCLKRLRSSSVFQLLLQRIGITE